MMLFLFSRSIKNKDLRARILILAPYKAGTFDMLSAIVKLERTKRRRSMEDLVPLFFVSLSRSIDEDHSTALALRQNTLFFVSHFFHDSLLFLFPLFLALNTITKQTNNEQQLRPVRPGLGLRRRGPRRQRHRPLLPHQGQGRRRPRLRRPPDVPRESLGKDRREAVRLGRRERLRRQPGPVRAVLSVSKKGRE